MESYRTLNHRVKNRNAPGIVYEDYETVDQVIRDLFTSDISGITLVFLEMNLYLNKNIHFLKIDNFH